MKVFVQSQNGEDGPFSLPELRRLFEEGKLDVDQLCRVDGASEQKALRLQFPEFATAMRDPEEEAWTKRRAQRRSKRIQSMAAGALLFVTGIACLFVLRPWKGVIMVVCGFVFFVNGCLMMSDG